MAEDAQVGVLEVGETIEHLDFTQPCDSRICERPAVWLGEWACCSLRDLSCTTHRLQIDLGAALGMEHTVCDRVVGSVAWEPYRKADR